MTQRLFSRTIGLYIRHLAFLTKLIEKFFRRKFQVPNSRMIDFSKSGANCFAKMIAAHFANCGLFEGYGFVHLSVVVLTFVW